MESAPPAPTPAAAAAATAAPAAAAAAAAAAARFGLSGKRVLVTGGTKGIGAAVVEEFCALGAQVYICSRNEEEVQSKVLEWRALGYDVQGSAADVSDELQRTELMQRVGAAFGGVLHVLVNNVGTNIRKPTVEYSQQEFQCLMSTNLESSFSLCQLCHPLLKAAGDACIIFNSSVAGGPTAMWSGTIYAMTKAAINQLSKNLACEWAADGIRVNAVAPWYTATPLANQVLQDEQLRSEVLSRTPMKRIGQPREVAGAMAFLASPAASYVTGQTLAVDGGYSVMGYYRP